MPNGSMPLNVVVLAAGEGTRMQSALPKVLHIAAGRSLLGHVLHVASALQAARTVVVLAESTVEQVRASFGARYEYVVQPERFGTGHAVLQAKELLVNSPGDVLVLYGDSPLIQVETARALVEARRASGAKAGLLSFHANPPTGYGRVLRDGEGRVAALIEERNATPQQRAISEANSGFMAFDGPWLWQTLPQVPRNPVKNEYYLTDLVEMAVAQFGPGAAIAVLAADARDAWGVNDRVQLADAERVLRERILIALMKAGVAVQDPSTTYVDAGVAVGRDSLLLPGTTLRGETSVGSNCTIGPYTTVEDSTIGNGARIMYAVIEGADIAPYTEVGPFVHIHPGAKTQS